MEKKQPMLKKDVLIDLWTTHFPGNVTQQELSKL